jgi:predicted metal-dependent HD superfamily phosphohydrolase
MTYKRLTESLAPILFYHNLAHTEKVLDFAEKIAAGEKIIHNDLTILRSAAVLHDTGFFVQYKKNEPMACVFAEQVLPGFGATSPEINRICSIIMATAIPQKPECVLSEILCDADLAYIGTDSFFNKSADLRREFAEQDRIFTEREWLEFEAGFFENHKFFTDTAVEMFESQKQKNLNLIKKKLANLS